MSSIARVAATTLALLLVGGCVSPIAVGSGDFATATRIDRRIDDLAVRHAVGGLGVGLVRDGRVAYLHATGHRDAGNALALTPDTVMYGASLTKAVFATFVMQLVDERRVDLDRSIADLLPRPLPDYPEYAALANDPRWRDLTLRRLLDHTSGFANFRWLEPDRVLRLHRDPGARYGYSGEGIQLAQFVIERGLGIETGREVQRRLFDPFGMSRTSMTWRDDFADDVAALHLRDDTVRPHRRRAKADAAGSLDTTLRDMTTFAAAMVRGDGLSPTAKAETIRRQVTIDSVSQFPTLDDARTDRDRPLALGYGIGWGVLQTPRGAAFFKEGHDDGTGNYVMCIDTAKSCIVLLSNSDRGEAVFASLVRMLMGVDIPWQWEGYAPPDDPMPAS